jgi:hypothetical protein
MFAFCGRGLRVGTFGAPRGGDSGAGREPDETMGIARTAVALW